MIFKITGAIILALAAFLTGFAFATVEHFRQEQTQSNFLKNDWTSCSTVYYPDPFLNQHENKNL